MSYICKKISKLRFRDPSEQGFLRFSELGSPDYIVKTTIFSVWVFLMVSVHGNTLYAIAIHKNRSITPFLTLWSHFENRTKKTLSILQLLRTYHISNRAIQESSSYSCQKREASCRRSKSISSAAVEKISKERASMHDVQHFLHKHQARSSHTQLKALSW